MLFLLFAHLVLASAQDQTFPSQRLLTRETSFGDRRDLGWDSFTRWAQNRWKETIQFIEHVSDVTGIDKIVHHFTGGDRIFNSDGSYNNEFLENAVENAIVVIDDLFSETGLDKVLHHLTGGCLEADRDGTECLNHLKDLALDVIVDPLIDQSKQLWESIQNGGYVGLDAVKDHVLTTREVNFLGEVLKGEVDVNNAAHRQELGEILQNRILKVVEEIRYGVGFVDGQRPVVVFGTGLDCSAASIVSGGASLNIFGNIPLYPDTLQEYSITSSVAVGIGANAGASCGQPYHFSFNTDPSDMAGLGITVSIEAASLGGIKVDFGFALMSDHRRFKLATISISPVVGAKLGVSASLTYTTVLRTIGGIPVNPVSDQIEKPAAWCADEHGVCECDGFVRYGFGDKWNGMEKSIDGSIGCNNQEFGDPFVGQKKICQCIPRIYGDHGFHFDLRGFTGNEIVTITDGQDTLTKQLSTSWKTFSARNANIVIKFTNGKGSSDVFFRSKTDSDIRSDDMFAKWRCDTSSQNHRCELVRKGDFLWETDYQIRFKRSNVVLAGINACDWTHQITPATWKHVDSLEGCVQQCSQEDSCQGIFRLPSLNACALFSEKCELKVDAQDCREDTWCGYNVIKSTTGGIKCNGKVNIWAPSWATIPDDDCATWWSNMKWGAKKDCSKCKSGEWGYQQCSKLCCEMCHASNTGALKNGEDFCEGPDMIRNKAGCQSSSCCHWNTLEQGEASFNGEGRCWSSIGTDVCQDV